LLGEGDGGLLGDGLGEGALLGDGDTADLLGEGDGAGLAAAAVPPRTARRIPAATVPLPAAARGPANRARCGSRLG
jgi:hypothetical protein